MGNTRRVDLERALSELSLGVRLRVVLDLLERHAGDRTPIARRSPASPMRLASIVVDPEGIASVHGARDASGILDLTWELLAGRPAGASDLAPLLEDVPHAIASVMAFALRGSAKTAGDLFIAVEGASRGVVDTNDDLRRALDRLLEDGIAVTDQPPAEPAPAAPEPPVPPVAQAPEAPAPAAPAPAPAMAPPPSAEPALAPAKPVVMPEPARPPEPSPPAQAPRRPPQPSRPIIPSPAGRASLPSIAGGSPRPIVMPKPRPPAPSENESEPVRAASPDPAPAPAPPPVAAAAVLAAPAPAVEAAPAPAAPPPPPAPPPPEPAKPPPPARPRAAAPQAAAPQPAAPQPAAAQPPAPQPAAREPPRRVDEPGPRAPSVPPPGRASHMREWIVIAVIALAFGAVVAFAVCNGQASRPELLPTWPEAPPDAGPH